MFVLPLAQIQEKQIALVGKKAFSITKLLKAKFLVPEGFVITAEAYRSFLKTNEIQAAIRAEMERISIEDLHSVDYASRILTDLLLHGDFSQEMAMEILQQFTHINARHVAVRSSAYTAEESVTWGGELKTALHIGPEDILAQVKACWASLFSTRALYYLYQRHINPEQVNFAILVQKMVGVHVAGIAYSVHPVSQDANQLVIEAGLGLGERASKGQVQPDTYVVQKNPFEILERNIHKQEIMTAIDPQGGTKLTEVQSKEAESQKLSDKQIEKLVQLCQKIEEVYGTATEVEWGLDGDFVFLQAREMKIS